MKSFTERWKQSVAGAVRGQLSLAEFLWCAVVVAVIVRIALLGGGWAVLAILACSTCLGGWIGWRKRYDPVEGIIGALTAPLALVLCLFIIILMLTAFIAIIHVIAQSLFSIP